jgi:hypothetical protein
MMSVFHHPSPLFGGGGVTLLIVYIRHIFTKIDIYWSQAHRVQKTTFRFYALLISTNIQGLWWHWKLPEGFSTTWIFVTLKKIDQDGIYKTSQILCRFEIEISSWWQNASKEVTWKHAFFFNVTEKWQFLAITLSGVTTVCHSVSLHFRPHPHTKIGKWHNFYWVPTEFTHQKFSWQALESWCPWVCLVLNVRAPTSWSYTVNQIWNI